MIIGVSWRQFYFGGLLISVTAQGEVQAVRCRRVLQDQVRGLSRAKSGEEV